MPSSTPSNERFAYRRREVVDEPTGSTKFVWNEFGQPWAGPNDPRRLHDAACSIEAASREVVTNALYLKA